MATKQFGQYTYNVDASGSPYGNPITTTTSTTTAPKTTTPTSITGTGAVGPVTLPTLASTNQSVAPTNQTSSVQSVKPVGVQTTTPASSITPVPSLSSSQTAAPKTGVFNGYTYNLDSSGSPTGNPISYTAPTTQSAAPTQTTTPTVSANAGFNANTSPTYTVQAGDKYNPYTGQPLTSTAAGTVINKTDSTAAADAAAKAAQEKLTADAAAKAYQEWVTRQNELTNAAGATKTEGTTPTAPTDTSYQGLLKQAADQVSYARAEQQKAADLQAKADQMATDLNKAERNVDTQRIMQESAAGQKSVMERTFGLEAQQANVAAAKQAAYAQAQQTGAGTLATLAGVNKPVEVQYGVRYGSPSTLAAGGGAGAEVPPTDPFYKTLVYYAGLMAKGEGEAVPANIKSNPVLGAQLDRMAKEINPNYNVNLAESSATLQGQGQQIETAGASATQALDSLQAAFNGMNAYTKTGIPVIDQMTTNISMATGIGRDKTSAYLGALQEARSQVSAVLSTIIGVNAAGAMADSLLPDSMQPSEIPGKIAAAKSYIQQRIDAYKASGSMMGGNPTQSTGGLTWETL